MSLSSPCLVRKLHQHHWRRTGRLLMGGEYLIFKGETPVLMSLVWCVSLQYSRDAWNSPKQHWQFIQNHWHFCQGRWFYAIRDDLRKLPEASRVSHGNMFGKICHLLEQPIDISGWTQSWWQPISQVQQLWDLKAEVRFGYARGVRTSQALCNGVFFFTYCTWVRWSP